MRLSREEFWVLDPTVHWNADLPLHCLFRPNRAEFLNKRKDIALSEKKLIDLLVFMQKQGIMTIFRHKINQCRECACGFCDLLRSPRIRLLYDFTPIWENSIFYSEAAIRDDVAMVKEHVRKNPGHAPLPSETLCYCMTPQGGERWEETAQVNWNKYLDCWGQWMDDADLAENQEFMIKHVAAISENVLNVYFDWKIRWDAHPDSLETKSFKRYHTERVAPWKATYWKTFPEGFECDYTELSTHFDLNRHRENGLTEEEEKRYQHFNEESSREYDSLFGWSNDHIPDFPFEGD